MKVSDLMTTSPITVGPETPVIDARQLMIDKRFRHVLITEGPKLLGIVTDRDIRLNLPSPATSLSVWEINYLLAQLTVASVMTESLVIVSPPGYERGGVVDARSQDRRASGRRWGATDGDHHRNRSAARLRESLVSA